MGGEQDMLSLQGVLHSRSQREGLLLGGGVGGSRRTRK